MAIQDTEELFDESGCIPVWGRVSSSGKPYYQFKLTSKDAYIMFPMTQQNPKAPKFVLRKTDETKRPGGSGDEE